MAKGHRVTISIGSVVFSDADYDEGQDTLHLAVADAPPTAWTEESAEGHTLGYGADGALVRQHIARNGGVMITPPRRFLERSDLEGVL
jgi:hypothetical protein